MAIRLGQYIGKYKFVRLERVFPGDQCLQGFLLRKGKDLLLMHEFFNFIDYGYTIIRNIDIVSCRSNKIDRIRETIVKGEGYSKLEYFDQIPLSNFGSMFNYFLEKDQVIEIERENKDSADEDLFYIGKVIEVDPERVWLREFDVFGKWCNTLTGIQLEKITKVNFNTPYINGYTHYILKE